MSRDLLNARRTLPIVHALSTLRGGSRERLQELLGATRESAECHAEVRTLLTAAGSMHYTALVVQVYRHRAQQLGRCLPRGSTGRALRMLLDGVSLLSMVEDPNC
jgi:hypothetical protein